MALDRSLRSQPLHLGDPALHQRAPGLCPASRSPSWRARRGSTRSSRVLDLGCGPGSLTLPLSRYCGTTIGMDADPAMIAAAAQASALAGLRDRVARRLLVRSRRRSGAARSRHHRPRLPLDGSRGDAEASRRADRAGRRRRPRQHRAAPARRAPAGTSRSRSCATRTAASTISTAGARAKPGRSTRACSCAARSARSSASRCSRRARPKLEEIVARALSFSANSPAALGDDGRAAYEARGARAHAGHRARRRLPGDRRERRHHRAPARRLDDRTQQKCRRATRRHLVVNNVGRTFQAIST